MTEDMEEYWKKIQSNKTEKDFEADFIYREKVKFEEGEEQKSDPIERGRPTNKKPRTGTGSKFLLNFLADVHQTFTASLTDVTQNSDKIRAWLTEGTSYHLLIEDTTIQKSIYQ